MITRPSTPPRRNSSTPRWPTTSPRASRPGELAPGARLPAERDLATEYGVSYDTIRRATALLRERGLIITIVGRGTYVKPAD